MENRFIGIGGKPVIIDEPVEAPPEIAEALAHLTPQARNILLNNLAAHGIAPETWAEVLNSTAAVVPPPFALKGSREGAERFIDALGSVAPDKKIAIWGDYDADGNTASTVLGTLARQIRPDSVGNIEHYIPRREEGYGLNIPGIAQLADKGVKSLFAVDTGTVAYEPIAYARSRGMEVVVLDHHQPRPGEPLPEGAVIINPHRRDETAPGLRDLAAAGISWLFARDVEEAYRRRGDAKTADSIDHGLITVAACLGTVADVVSLQSPINRYIIEHGLAEMQTGRYPGIEAMKGLFGIRTIRESDIAFAIGPSINASGRLDDPTVGMRMLLATSQPEAEKLAKELTAYNDERKQFSNHIIFQDATEQAAQFMQAYPTSPLLMVEDSHWMGGVVGIVASRLKERYGLPTLAGHAWRGKDDKDYITYSARSIEQVDMFRLLSTAFQSLPEGAIVKFGGHAMAAGLTIRADAKQQVLSAMQDALNGPVRKALAQDATRAAAEVVPDDLTVDTVRSFYQFGPYGARIAPPRLLVRNMQAKQVRAMGDKGEHLQVALGAPEHSTPDEALRYGTAFRAQGSPLGELLQDTNRHNQAFDVIIEPYVFEKKSGDAAVGYHLIDASPARIVSQSPNPQDILHAHLQRLADFRAEREKEKERVRSLPHKIQDLLSGKSPEVQAILKHMHDARISVIDTETTGKAPSHPDHEKTNGLTQVAVGKVVRVGRNGEARYAFEAKSFPVLPVTPAYYEYAAKAKEALARKEAPPPYDKMRYEYVIAQEALDVTGTSFQRDDADGRIKAMIVNGEKVPARPLWEVAADITAFLQGTVPHAYNVPFDARAVVKQFSDLLAAREIKPDSEPHTRIDDDALRGRYRESTERLKTLIGGEDITADTPSFLKHMLSPVDWCCVMHAALMHKGERQANRQEDVALLYQIAFERDPNRHDAGEDIGPLFFMIHDQVNHFGRQVHARLVPPELAAKFPQVGNQILHDLQTKPYTMRDLWELLAKDGDAQAQAIPCAVAVEEKEKKPKKRKKGEPEAPEMDDPVKITPRLRLTFPSAKKDEFLPGIGGYLGTLAVAKRRNSRIPTLILESDGTSVTLDAATKMDSDVPLFSTFKKSLCAARLLRSGLASKVLAFDSTGLADITLSTAPGTPEIIIEDVPIPSLRKSLDFLLDPAARAHAQDYLELLRWINSLPESGLATLDPNGITIRGLQRNFGDIRMVLPPDKTLIEALPEIRAHARKLLALGSVPGALKTEYVVTQDEMEDGVPKGTCGLHLATHYRLDAPHRVLMEVSTPLLSLVAQEKGYGLDGEHFIWPGGLVGQKAPEGDFFILHGALEAFEEAGQQIRNAAWLLYRFNQLPGVNAGKTALSGNGTLTLTCQEKLPLETAWILHRAHVPFKATARTLEIPMPELMHDAFHWYWEIRKEQDYVKNEMDKKQKQPSTLLDRIQREKEREKAIAEGREPAPPDSPAKPPVFLEAAWERLTAGVLKDMHVNRIGELFVTIGTYPQVPVESSAALLERAAREDPAQVTIESPLFKTPAHNGVTDTGLAVRLAQLHGVQENYSMLEAGNAGECIITPPAFDTLGSKQMLIDEFRAMSRLARSAHINPLLDTLRGIVKSDDMKPAHAEPLKGESPVTLARMESLNKGLQDILPHIEPITQDIHAFTFNEARLKEEIFRHVAQLNLIRQTLAEAHSREQLQGVSEQDYRQMQAALESYYESLSMAEFKRHRLEIDGRQVIASFERLKKARAKQEERLASDPLYGPYLAHKELSGAIEKLWEDGKRYKRTLDFSDEIIRCGASLRDWRKTEWVEKAIACTHAFRHHNIGIILNNLRTEGGTEHFMRQGDAWRVDVKTLGHNPAYWGERLGELLRGMQPVPLMPHMVIDTSSMMTLLLGNDSIPGDRQAGYLGILQDLAQHHAIIPVLTGAVVAELLNSPIPLNPQDIFVMSKEGKAVGVKYSEENRRHLRFRNGGKHETEYPKWAQRLDFLMELYNSGTAEFVETPTERQYCDAIRAHEELQKRFRRIIADFPGQVAVFHGKSELAEITNEELKAFLLSPTQARQKFMDQMRAAKIRKDIGEVSMADAIKHIHDMYGTQAPVFVLYEGNDVRGRIVQRIALGMDGYMAGTGKQSRLKAECDPGNEKFDTRHAAALHHTKFVSTPGFLAILMETAKKYGMFIVGPQEHHHGMPEDVDNAPTDSYPGVIRIIREKAGKAIKGEPRPYDKFVDEDASQLGKSRRHSKSFTDGPPGPLKRQMEELDPEIVRKMLIAHMLRNRAYHESNMRHRGNQKDAEQQCIDDINASLRRIAPTLVSHNPGKLPVESFAPGPDAPMAITAHAQCNPDAIDLAQLVLNEHAKTLAGRAGAEEPQIKLPLGIRFKVQAIPKKERVQVVAQASEIIRNSLKASPREVAYAEQYRAMLESILENPKRQRGAN